MRDYLVVTRAGDRSLHPRWLSGWRNWDLALSCYGTKPPERSEVWVAVTHVGGPMWDPLHSFLTDHADLVSRYGYVMLPDDDLLLSPVEISRFFSICDRQCFALAQPSLDY